MSTRHGQPVRPGPVEVSDFSTAKLVEVVRSPGGDTIGFAANTPPCDVTLSVEDDLQAFTRKLLDGRIAVPAGHAMMPMNAVAARLIAHQGVHPVAVAALGSMIDIMTLVRGDDMRIMTHRDLAVCSVYAEGFSWTEMDIASIRLEGAEHRNTPASVLAAMIGRRLRDVVSHPAMDRLDVRIATAEPDEFGDMLNIGVVLDTRDVALTREALEALAPTT